MGTRLRRGDHVSLQPHSRPLPHPTPSPSSNLSILPPGRLSNVLSLFYFQRLDPILVPDHESSDQPMAEGFELTQHHALPARPPRGSRTAAAASARPSARGPALPPTPRGAQAPASCRLSPGRPG